MTCIVDQTRVMQVLVLDKPVEKWRKPIKMAPSIDYLNKTRFNLPDGFEFTVLGWGMLWEDGPNSMTLQEATVDYQPKAKCINYLKKANPAFAFVPKEMICAGDPEKSEDTCQNDSGGPLFYKGPNGPRSDILVGITSNGIECAGSTPGVYTDVSYYRKTIDGFLPTLLKRYPVVAG